MQRPDIVAVFRGSDHRYRLMSVENQFKITEYYQFMLDHRAAGGRLEQLRYFSRHLTIRDAMMDAYRFEFKSLQGEELNHFEIDGHIVTNFDFLHFI